jgi:hypothetical protein
MPMGHALYKGTDYELHEFSTSVTNPKGRGHMHDLGING